MVQNNSLKYHKTGQYAKRTRIFRTELVRFPLLFSSINVLVIGLSVWFPPYTLGHLSIFLGTAGKEQKNVLLSALLRIQSASSPIPSSCVS